MEKQWAVTPVTDGLGEFSASWDLVNKQVFGSNPLLDSRFVNSLLSHFGTGREYLCSMQENGTPVAMCLMQQRGAGIWISFLPAQTQLGPSLIRTADQVASLTRELTGPIGRLDLLCHDPMYGNLLLGNALASSQDHALTMNIGLHGSFDDYWSSRSKQLQKNMRRYERRLEEDQLASRFVCVSAPEDVSAAVERYAGIESSGWKSKIGTAIDMGTAQGRFYDGVMQRFAEPGGAVVYELWLGDRLAASRLAVFSDEMIVILKTTYDESMEKYAPGRLLLREVIQSAFTHHSGKTLEFYTDASPDQLSWATDCRRIRHLSVPNSLFAAMAYGLGRFARRTFKGINAEPKAMQSLLAVDVFRHLDDLPHDVVALFDRAESESVEFGISWYRNLVNTVFKDQGTVRLFVLRSSGRPIAALPMLVEKTGWGNRAQALSNYYTSVFAPVLSPDIKVVELAWLVRAVHKEFSPLGSLQFAPMDPQSSTYFALRAALRAAHLLPFDYYCFGNWFLKAPAGWDAYLTSRTASLRSTIKRMSKKFSGDGGVLELLVDAADVERGMQAYEQVYSASWKVAEPYPNFVQGLARRCGERGWLRLGIAWLNGKPIAAEFWIVANGTASIYKVAYDENYKTYTPGTLVTAMLMQRVIEVDRVDKVDYLIGDDSYKKTWMSDRQERWGIVAYNPLSITGCLGLAREVLGRTVKPWLARIKKR